MDSLAYIHLNQTLFRRIDEIWPGEQGREAFAAELASFRALRAAVQVNNYQCVSSG